MKRYSKMLLLALLALAAVFFVNGATSPASAATQATQQVTTPDQAPEPEPEYTEEEYAAWENADKEADLLKRGTMLIEVIQKYPKSKLMPYVDSSYSKLLFECSEGKKYQELETLAEQWDKIKPANPQTLALIATAAEFLGHDEKCVKCLEEIYKIYPQADYALKIAQIYRKLKNDSKFIQWIGTVLKFPEHDADFRLRYDLMQFYAGNKDMVKATEFARATLKAADLVKDPGEDTQKALRATRHQANHVIGVTLYDQEKYEEAIPAFQKAIKAEKYADGYYWIGMCQWAQKKVEEAILTFAKAEQQGGDIAPKAKDKLEQLYKALHNNTTIGIEKVYRRAKETPDNF